MGDLISLHERSLFKDIPGPELVRIVNTLRQMRQSTPHELTVEIWYRRQVNVGRYWEEFREGILNPDP